MHAYVNFRTIFILSKGPVFLVYCVPRRYNSTTMSVTRTTRDFLDRYSRRLIKLTFWAKNAYILVLLFQSSCTFQIKMRIFHLIWIHRNWQKRMQFCFNNFWFHQKQDKDKRRKYENTELKLRTLAAGKIDIHLLFILLYSWIKNRKYDTWIRETQRCLLTMM